MSDTTTATGKTIDDVVQDTSVTGVEKIPMSDSRVAKFATVEQLKDFVVSKIKSADAASSASVGGFSVYILQSGDLKRVDSEDLAKGVLNYGFAKVGVVSINGNEVVSVKDASVQKTVTLSGIKSWIGANLDLGISAMDDLPNPIEGDNAYLVVDRVNGGSSENRKISMTNFTSWALGTFSSYVNSLASAASVSDDDVVYVVNGGVAKKCALSLLRTFIGAGNVSCASATTEGNIPRWSSTGKTLNNGLAVTDSIASVPSGTKIPTEQAVRNALSEAGNVSGPENPTVGNIPVWSGTKTLGSGKTPVNSVRSQSSASNDCVPTEKAVSDALAAKASVSSAGSDGNIPTWDENGCLTSGKQIITSVRQIASASDEAVPTEKAVRRVAEGFVSSPSSHEEDCIPTWGADNSLKGGKTVATMIGSEGSHDKIPTEKAVRDAIPGVATTQANGLMSASDKTKLDGLADTGAVEEIGTALRDVDTVVVKVGDSTYRKSLLSRFWTYVYSKLSTVAIDSFAEATDSTKNNATTSAHGLLPKLPGGTDTFLRADGQFAAPSGSVPFSGDSGSGGTQGLVPAPSAGAAAANKFLCSDGTWAVTPAAAGVDIPGAGAIDSVADADALYIYDASSGEYKSVSASNLWGYVKSRVRFDTLFVPAGALTPATNNGASVSALRFYENTHDVAVFPGDSDSSAEFNFAMPCGWNGGQIRARAYWTTNSSSGEAGQTVCFSFGAVALDDSDPITSSPSASASVTDAMLAANEMHVTPPTSLFSISGDGNFVHMKVSRVTEGKTMTQSVQLMGIEIQFGRNDSGTEWI